MKEITVWYRHDDKQRKFEFNHTEYGHVPWEQQEPEARSVFQTQMWKNGLWVKHHKHLDDAWRVV